MSKEMLSYIERMMQMRDILERTQFSQSAHEEIDYDINAILADKRY